MKIITTLILAACLLSGCVFNRAYLDIYPSQDMENLVPALTITIKQDGDSGYKGTVGSEGSSTEAGGADIDGTLTPTGQ